MSFSGHLQLAAPCLISLDDGDAVQTEEIKLINDSESHYQGLSECTLAEMMLVDSAPKTPYHEDLSSLVILPVTNPLPTIQCPGSIPTGTQSLIANQLAGRQGQLTSLDTITTSMPGSKYVDSLTRYCIPANLGEVQQLLVENDGRMARNLLCSMYTTAVRNREVQTLSATPSVSSEAVTHSSNPPSGLTISVSEAEINSTDTVTLPTADSYDNTAELQPLTVVPTTPISVSRSLSSIAPSTGHSMDQNGAFDHQATNTALETRTTQDVIADLKHPLGSSFQPHKETQNLSSSHLLGGSHSSNHTQIKYSREREEESYESDEDEYDRDMNDESRPSTKTRKISERKRRMNAIADQYILTAVEKAARKDNEVKPEDEAHQSARWYVNQQENREIISSPREYQTELFARAKE